MFVTIVRRPQGEAPEWVRDAWIGLRLPADCGHRHVYRGFGILTRPKGMLPQLRDLLTGRSTRIDGYAVNAREAVDLLAASRPAAAGWWREHTPYLLDGRTLFVFDAEACQAAEG